MSYARNLVYSFVNSSWDAWWKAHFRDTEDGLHTMWVTDGEILPLMTPKFRRIQERVLRRVTRDGDLVIHDSRRCVEVATRKYKSRRGRKS